ncbi:unnamed protein product, partial [Ilex paraguariensis]
MQKISMVCKILYFIDISELASSCIRVSVKFIILYEMTKKENAKRINFDLNKMDIYFQFYSTTDGSYDDYSFACASDFEIGESRKVSLVAESDCSMDVENEVGEIKVHLGKSERDCQICHLSLESTGPESGIAIELGCSYKDDLAAAHKHCADTWFKIKGN